MKILKNNMKKCQVECGVCSSELEITAKDIKSTIFTHKWFIICPCCGHYLEFEDKVKEYFNLK